MKKSVWLFGDFVSLPRFCEIIAQPCNLQTKPVRSTTPRIDTFRAIRSSPHRWLYSITVGSLVCTGVYLVTKSLFVESWLDTFQRCFQCIFCDCWRTRREARVRSQSVIQTKMNPTRFFLERGYRNIDPQSRNLPPCPLMPNMTRSSNE